MTTRTAVAAGVGALALAAGGVTTAALVSSGSTTAVTTQTIVCADMPGLSVAECGAAGIIRWGALPNLQGAAQFCKWKAANPGEWSRIKGYSETSLPPTSIITWLGASIRDELQAYFALNAPTFIIQPNTAPNVCKTPIAGPQGVRVVGEDETSVTMTWTSP